MQLADTIALLRPLNEQKGSGDEAPESVELMQALLAQLGVVNDRLAELRGPAVSP